MYVFRIKNLLISLIVRIFAPKYTIVNEDVRHQRGKAPEETAKRGKKKAQ